MSQSEQNLKEAFAGESQANRKYLAFAKKADQEGFPNVARLFRAVAAAETCKRGAEPRGRCKRDGLANREHVGTGCAAVDRRSPESMSDTAETASPNSPTQLWPANH